MEFKRIALSRNGFNRETKTAERKRKVVYTYWLFAVVRILLCLVPQNGYIHPDEFFQSIEPISEHYFDIDTYKPWEFNSTFPIRTIVYPFVSVGIPYSIISNLLQYSSRLGINLKSVYFLVTLPRLLMCMLSFVNDYCLYKICRINDLDHNKCLVIFSSSYVMLTYASRTFSNNSELILFSLLLYYVSRCIDFSNKVVYQGNRLKKKYSEAQTIVDRVKVYKLMNALPSHSLNDCLIIASITVAGIFNRPTFIAFAACPIFFWLQRGLGSLVVNFIDFHIRIITFVICTIPALFLFILADSFYFGYLTMGEIGRLDVGINNFVVTPLNFVKYNTVVSNLKEHGLHPRCLHFLVNVPLLFNIYGVIGLGLILKMFYRIIKKRWLELPRIQSIEGLMIASFAIPIAILSTIPHQEARFIIPVLFPLSICCTPMIRQNSTFENHNHRGIVKSNSNHQTEHSKSNTNRVQLVWHACNLVLMIFYGFLHQGGVLPLTSHVAMELKAKPELTHVHLFTSYTYSIPTALLHLRNTKKVYVSSDNHKFKLIQDFYLYEKGGQELKSVIKDIVMKMRQCKINDRAKKLPYRIYYAIPGSAVKEFAELAFNNYQKDFEYHRVKDFYPHLSTEMMPANDFLRCLLYDKRMLDCLNMFLRHPSDNVMQFFSQFRLVLFKIVPTKES